MTKRREIITFPTGLGSLGDPSGILEDPWPAFGRVFESWLFGACALCDGRRVRTYDEEGPSRSPLRHHLLSHVALPLPPQPTRPLARWSGLAWRPGRIRSGDGDKSPFYARGTGQRAALCLHGFTGTPFEVRPLAEALAAQGYTTLAPVLAGHGGTVDDLAGTTHADWLASAAT